MQAALLALDNANARETSFLTVEDWRALVAVSFAATCTTGAAALLTALDQDAAMGFVEAGRADLQPTGKTVRYWEKLLQGQPGAPACNP